MGAVRNTVIRRQTVKASDLDRVLKALAKAGKDVSRIIIRPSGEVEITPALTGGAPAVQLDELAEWRGRRDGRRAR